MLGINKDIFVHKLNVKSDHKPVKQKKRNFVLERQLEIEEEVKKLLAIGFIEESTFPEWLANVIVVKKEDGK